MDKSLHESFGSKYELVGRIAEGGMAEIFLAEAKGAAGFNKKVVIKRVLPGLAKRPSFVEMFLHEAKVSAGLAHPNIVQVFDFGHVDDAYFIAMEYVDGRSLRHILSDSRRMGVRLPFSTMAYVVSCVAQGLYAAHTAVDAEGKPLSIVHRDVSLSNVLVSFDGAVKVADFGIAKAASAQVRTRTGVVKGKYGYMAPQQCLGQPIDHRADLFSLGVVLYELTTLRRLFSRKTEAETINALLHLPITPPSEIVEGYPKELEGIVMHCLERDPAKRYSSARDLLQDLETFVRESGEVVGPMVVADTMSAIYPEHSRSLAPLIDSEDSYDELLAASNHSGTSSRNALSARDYALASAFLAAGSGLVWLTFLALARG